MTDAEDEIRICERFAEQGLKRSRVGAEADAKIDVRRDHANQRAVTGCGRNRAPVERGESLAKKRKRLGGVAWITVWMMLGGQGSHVDLNEDPHGRTFKLSP